MQNYIINTYNKIKMELQPEKIEIMRKYTPRGCPFNNYTMLDLLIDFINMYSWKLETGRTYTIIEFLNILNDIKAITYKNFYIELFEEG